MAVAFSFSVQFAASLTGGSFEEARMLKNVEACEWLTGAIRSLEVPNLDPCYVNMRAVSFLYVLLFRYFLLSFVSLDSYAAISIDNELIVPRTCFFFFFGWSVGEPCWMGPKLMKFGVRMVLLNKTNISGYCCMFHLSVCHLYSSRSLKICSGLKINSFNIITELVVNRLLTKFSRVFRNDL